MEPMQVDIAGESEHSSPEDNFVVESATLVRRTKNANDHRVLKCNCNCKVKGSRKVYNITIRFKLLAPAQSIIRLV